MEPDILKPPKETCVSCGAKLKGDYCRKCGEKKIVPERDFSLAKFMNLTLWHFIHFDSKILRTVGLLFSKPGFLTAEWIAGRRVKYMKPVQLFVLASVLFYFFLPTTTAHFTGFRDFVTGYHEGNMFLNTFHFNFEKAFAEKAMALQLSEVALVGQLTTAAAHQSKTWLFLIIPVWGSLIFLLFRRKIPWIAPHLIWAMHGLTFYILLDLGIHAILAITGFPNIGRYIFFTLMAVFPVYQLLATRRVYGYSWLATIVRTIGIALGFIAIILLYRQVMTIAAVTIL